MIRTKSIISLTFSQAMHSMQEHTCYDHQYFVCAVVVLTKYLADKSFRII